MAEFDVEVERQDSQWDRFLASLRPDIGYMQFSYVADLATEAIELSLRRQKTR